MRATQVVNGAKAALAIVRKKSGATPPKSERLARKRDRFRKQKAFEEKRQLEKAAFRQDSTPNHHRRKPRRL